MIAKARALVQTWLLIDFFAETRRTGQPGSSLTSTIFTQSFIALVLAALLFDRDVGLVGFAAANLSLSTLLVGIGALANPQSVERRLSDRLLVSTAPVPRALLPVARLMHGAFHIGLVTIGTALPPAILSAFVAHGAIHVVPLYLVLAVVLAGSFAGALGLGVSWIERRAGAVRAALIAGSLKALLLGGGLIAFALCLPHVDESTATLPGGAAAALAWPPYWAARFLAAPLSDGLFGAALLALGAALFGAAVALGDGEAASGHARRRRNRPGALDALERRLAQRGPLLGTTTWTSTMLFRSPGFRARVLPLFGIPLAMVLLAFAEEGARERVLLLGVTLQLPAVYLPFLIAFLPHADQDGSAWLFETSPEHSTTLAREAALIALSVRILLPVYALAGLVVAGLGFGITFAIGLASFSFALAVLVAVFAVRRLEHVAFTAGSDEPPALEFGGLVGVALVLAALGGADSLIAGSVPGILVGAAATAAAIHHLRKAPSRASAVSR